MRAILSEGYLKFQTINLKTKTLIFISIIQLFSTLPIKH